MKNNRSIVISRPEGWHLCLACTMEADVRITFNGDSFNYCKKHAKEKLAKENIPMDLDIKK